MNRLDGHPMIRSFLETHGHRIDHGLIVFGSYYREHCAGTANSSDAPRDIDIILLQNAPVFRHFPLWHQGTLFDVHECGIEQLGQLIFEQRDLTWIRNLFASELLYGRDEVATRFLAEVKLIRTLSPRVFLFARRWTDDSLLIDNHWRKLSREPFDLVSFSYFFHAIVQTIYYWSCLRDGIWPSAHPQFVRADIRKRFPALESEIIAIEAAAQEAKIAQLGRMLGALWPKTYVGKTDVLGLQSQSKKPAGFAGYHAAME